MIDLTHWDTLSFTLLAAAALAAETADILLTAKLGTPFKHILRGILPALALLMFLYSMLATADSDEIPYPPLFKPLTNGFLKLQSSGVGSFFFGFLSAGALAGIPVGLFIRWLIDRKA